MEWVGEPSPYGVRCAAGSRVVSSPPDWVEDSPRCRAAGIPEGVPFATKPMLGKRILERAFQAGVPCGWVAGDEVNGCNSKLRRWLEEYRQPFVLAVAADQRLW